MKIAERHTKIKLLNSNDSANKSIQLENKPNMPI